MAVSASPTTTAPPKAAWGLPERWSNIVVPIAFLLVLVLLWEGIVRLGVWPPYSLPSPFSVFDKLVNGVGDGSIFKAVALSMKRMLIGFVASLVMGITLGIAIARFKLVEQTLGSLVTGLQALPSICWLPIALIWFGLSDQAIIFVVILGSMMAITQSTADGVKNTPTLLLRAASSLGARGPVLYTKVILPASFPYMITGMKLGWSFAWRSLMAAELLFFTPGLGHLLEVGRQFNDIAQVMAMMIIIVLAGLVVDRLVFVRLESIVRKRWGLTGIRGG